MADTMGHRPIHTGSKFKTGMYRGKSNLTRGDSRGKFGYNYQEHYLDKKMPRPWLTNPERYRKSVQG
jgi:hypothetical protein